MSAQTTADHIPLDMQAITREALGLVKKRAWSLTYSSYGIEFKWAGYADTQQEADTLARQQLDEMYSSFSRRGAQLTAAIEVSA